MKRELSVNKDLCWYVFNYDWNTNEVIIYDVCHILRFDHCKKELLAVIKNRDKFEERLKQLCKYYFWSRREYEISIGDAFETDCSRLEKFDIWDQLELNWTQFVNYIFNNYKKKEGKYGSKSNN